MPGFSSSSTTPADSLLLPPPPPLPSDNASGGDDRPLLTNASLARHDEAEAAKRRAVGEVHTNGGVSGAGRLTGAAASGGRVQERCAVARRTAAGGWPGLPVQHQSHRHGELSSVAGVGVGSITQEDYTRDGAVQGLVAMGGSGLGHGSGSAFVDLTGGRGYRSAEEIDDEELQKAIQLSLQDLGANVSGGRGGSPGDDTDTDEEPGYGAHPSVGESSSEAGPAAPTPTSPEFAPPSSAIADGGSAEIPLSAPPLAPGAPTAPVDSQDAAAADGRSTTDSSGDSRDGVIGGGGGRGAAGRLYESDSDSFRRLRRRRDESGASTPGEQSPEGPDGVTAGEQQEGHESDGGMENGRFGVREKSAGGGRRDDDSAGMLQNGKDRRREGQRRSADGDGGGLRSNGRPADGALLKNDDNGKGALQTPPLISLNANGNTSASGGNGAAAGSLLSDHKDGGRGDSVGVLAAAGGDLDAALRWNHDYDNKSAKADTTMKNSNAAVSHNANSSVVKPPPSVPATSENSENYSASLPSTPAGALGAAAGGAGSAYQNGWGRIPYSSDSAAAAAAATTATATNPIVNGPLDPVGSRAPLPFPSFAATREPLSETGLASGMVASDSAGLGNVFMADVENDALVRAAGSGGGLGEDTGSAGLTNLLAATEWDNEVSYVCVSGLVSRVGCWVLEGVIFVWC